MAAAYTVARVDDLEDARRVRVTSPRPAPAPGGCWALPSAVALLVTLSLAAMAAVAALAPKTKAAERQLEAKADINLFVINTERGPVPKTLGVSGVDCGVTGYHLLLNGNYTYQGESHGRPFYKSTVAHPEPAMPTPENPLPWYGAIGNLKGFWKTPKFHHTYLYYTGDASGSASSNLDAVNSVPGPAEALPPRKATWNVLCDSTAWNNSDLLTAHQLKLRARGEIESDMSGQWRYERLVMKGSKSIVTQRQVESKMQGGKERDSGGASLDFLGGADHLGLHYTKQLGRSWETTISNAEESTIETRYSRSGALWVWIYDFKEKTLGTDLGSRKSSEYAITDSIAQKPTCCPGYAADFPAYQSCVPGGELPHCAVTDDAI